MNRRVLDKITNAAELDAAGEDGQPYLAKAMSYKELLTTISECNSDHRTPLLHNYISETYRLKQKLEKKETQK